MSLQHATADTSRIAFQEHKESGKLGRQHRLIIAFLCKNAHRTFTRNELSASTDIALSAICGRVNELVKLHVLEELPRRACMRTGKQAHPVRMAGTQGNLFED